MKDEFPQYYQIYCSTIISINQVQIYRYAFILIQVNTCDRLNIEMIQCNMSLKLDRCLMTHDECSSSFSAEISDT